MSEYAFMEHKVRMDFSKHLAAHPEVTRFQLYKKCGINGVTALGHYTGDFADPTSPSTRTRIFFENLAALCRLLDISPWEVLHDYVRPYEGPDNAKPYTRIEPTEEELAFRFKRDETFIFRLPIRAEVYRIREFVLKWNYNYWSAMGLVYGTNIISSRILDLTLMRENVNLRDCLTVMDMYDFDELQKQFDPRIRKKEGTKKD